MKGLYHGWYVLAVAALAGVLTAGSSQMFLGSILPFLTAETGWSGSAITGAVFTGTLLGGLFAPLAGILNDRHGPRLLLPGAGIVLALGYLLIASAGTLVVFYIGYALARLAAQGTLGGAVLRSIPVSWFHRYRGRTMGIVTMAVPLGAALIAMIAQAVLAAGFNWRATLAGLSLATLVLMVVPGWLLLRKGPESLGLRPDGDTAPMEIESTERVNVADEPRWTVAEAYRTRTMWLLVLATVLGIGANGAMIFYHVTYLVEVGLSPVMAVTCSSTLALCGAVANLGWGFLAERYTERSLAIVSQCGAAVLVLAMLQVSGLWGALGLAVGLGVMIRGESSLISLMVATYFGRYAYGRIIGLLTTFQLIGLGSGPLLAALLYDATGSFSALYVALSVIYVVTALLFLCCAPPRHAAVAA